MQSKQQKSVAGCQNRQ